MDLRNRKLGSVGVITVALLGALTYAVCRNRSLTKAAAKTEDKNAQQPHKQSQQKEKTTMTLPPESTIPPSERAKALELLEVLKQQANLAFQENRYEDALRRYQDCLEVTAVLGAHDAEAVKVDQVVRANVIMTFIRLQNYDAAGFVATMLLQDPAVVLPDELKVKVLYRRGLASKFTGDKEAALADFKAALFFSKEQSSPALAKEIDLLEKGQ